MIRFACPGCDKTFKVDDSKAGKTVNCPQCQLRFQIPEASAEDASGSSDPNEPVEISPCPKCGMELTVAAEYLGAEVECPGCQTAFTASKKATTKPAPPPPSHPKKPASAPVVEIDEDEDEEEVRPSRRRRVVDEDEDEEDVRPSRRRRVVDEDEDEEELERPSRRKSSIKKKRTRTAGVESKRMTAALLALFVGSFGIHKFYLGYTTAGIITILTCGGCLFIPFIEFIIYLTKSDEEFIETYQLNEKQWF